jgi:hypothetical protein
MDDAIGPAQEQKKARLILFKRAFLNFGDLPVIC